MESPREGGCVCGAVRYRVTHAPFRTGVCHCKFCQRRTGSAFGVGVYFRKTDFELTRGTLKSYEHRSDESNRWLKMEFCPQCGTTVTQARALAIYGDDVRLYLAIDRAPPKSLGDRLRRDVGRFAEPRGVAGLDLIA